MADSCKLRFGANVRRLRQSLSMTQETLAEVTSLDRSYIGGIERGERNPTLSAILRLAESLKIAPTDLFEGIGQNPQGTSALNGISATEKTEGLVIQFKYDQFDAEYFLAKATRREFDAVLAELRHGLAASSSRADAVASSFLRAVRIWPHANPSDLWIFLINHAYCDRRNHPEANARLNLEQSWKRTSGWALERVLVSHYGQFLAQNELRVEIANTYRKITLFGHLQDHRVIPDKADVLLSYSHRGKERLLGVVHVKASIAERRTDDVPMSQALMEAGHISVFWTMDSKAMPAPRPNNRGEFGEVDEGSISEKRKDFEENGNFSACFSYNRNTIETKFQNAVARIFKCDFTNPDDSFSRFLIDALRQQLNR